MESTLQHFKDSLHCIGTDDGDAVTHQIYKDTRLKTATSSATFPASAYAALPFLDKLDIIMVYVPPAMTTKGTIARVRSVSCHTDENPMINPTKNWERYRKEWPNCIKYMEKISFFTDIKQIIRLLDKGSESSQNLWPQDGSLH